MNETLNDIGPEPVIIYHDNCHDGITALWCALQRWPRATPYAAKYDVPPDLERLRHQDVVVVDFSWKLKQMLSICSVARNLLVLDHHKTAAAELEGLEHAITVMNKKVRVCFDMERSGAGIAWDVLMGQGGVPMPLLVDYVEDRDLWRFKLSNSKEVHAACSTYPLTVEVRDILMNRSIESLVTEGAGILRYHDKLVESAAKHALTESIGGYTVPSISCPTIEIVSDLGNRLAVGHPFAAVWVDRSDGTRSYSLRSTNEGVDVGEVAKTFGGGGHRNAAGFIRKVSA